MSTNKEVPPRPLPGYQFSRLPHPDEVTRSPTESEVNMFLLMTVNKDDPPMPLPFPTRDRVRQSVLKFYAASAGDIPVDDTEACPPLDEMWMKTDDADAGYDAVYDDASGEQQQQQQHEVEVREHGELMSMHDMEVGVGEQAENEGEKVYAEGTEQEFEDVAAATVAAALPASPVNEFMDASMDVDAAAAVHDDVLPPRQYDEHVQGGDEGYDHVMMTDMHQAQQQQQQQEPLYGEGMEQDTHNASYEEQPNTSCSENEGRVQTHVEGGGDVILPASSISSSLPPAPTSPDKHDEHDTLEQATRSSLPYHNAGTTRDETPSTPSRGTRHELEGERPPVTPRHSSSTPLSARVERGMTARSRVSVASGSGGKDQEQAVRGAGEGYGVSIRSEPVPPSFPSPPAAASQSPPSSTTGAEGGGHASVRAVPPPHASEHQQRARAPVPASDASVISVSGGGNGGGMRRDTQRVMSQKTRPTLGAAGTRAPESVVTATVSALGARGQPARSTVSTSHSIMGGGRGLLPLSQQIVPGTDGSSNRGGGGGSVLAGAGGGARNWGHEAARVSHMYSSAAAAAAAATAAAASTAASVTDNRERGGHRRVPQQQQQQLLLPTTYTEFEATARAQATAYYTSIMDHYKNSGYADLQSFAASHARDYYKKLMTSAPSQSAVSSTTHSRVGSIPANTRGESVHARPQQAAGGGRAGGGNTRASYPTPSHLDADMERHMMSVIEGGGGAHVRGGGARDMNGAGGSERTVAASDPGGPRSSPRVPPLVRANSGWLASAAAAAAGGAGAAVTAALPQVTGAGGTLMQRSPPRITPPLPMSNAVRPSQTTSMPSLPTGVTSLAGGGGAGETSLMLGGGGGVSATSLTAATATGGGAASAHMGAAAAANADVADASQLLPPPQIPLTPRSATMLVRSERVLKKSLLAQLHAMPPSLLELLDETPTLEHDLDVLHAMVNKLSAVRDAERNILSMKQMVLTATSTMPTLCKKTIGISLPGYAESVAHNAPLMDAHLGEIHRRLFARRGMPGGPPMDPLVGMCVLVLAPLVVSAISGAVSPFVANLTVMLANLFVPELGLKPLTNSTPSPAATSTATITTSLSTTAAAATGGGGINGSGATAALPPATTTTSAGMPATSSGAVGSTGGTSSVAATGAPFARTMPPPLSKVDASGKGSAHPPARTRLARTNVVSSTMWSSNTPTPSVDSSSSSSSSSGGSETPMPTPTSSAANATANSIVTSPSVDASTVSATQSISTSPATAMSTVMTTATSNAPPAAAATASPHDERTHALLQQLVAQLGAVNDATQRTATTLAELQSTSNSHARMLGDLSSQVATTINSVASTREEVATASATAAAAVAAATAAARTIVTPTSAVSSPSTRHTQSPRPPPTLTREDVADMISEVMSRMHESGALPQQQMQGGSPAAMRSWKEQQRGAGGEDEEEGMGSGVSTTLPPTADASTYSYDEACHALAVGESVRYGGGSDADVAHALGGMDGFMTTTHEQQQQQQQQQQQEEEEEEVLRHEESHEADAAQEGYITNATHDTTGECVSDVDMSRAAASDIDMAGNESRVSATSGEDGRASAYSWADTTTTQRRVRVPRGGSEVVSASSQRGTRRTTTSKRAQESRSGSAAAAGGASTSIRRAHASRGHMFLDLSAAPATR